MEVDTVGENHANMSATPDGAAWGCPDFVDESVHHNPKRARECRQDMAEGFHAKKEKTVAVDDAEEEQEDYYDKVYGADYQDQNWHWERNRVKSSMSGAVDDEWEAGNSWLHNNWQRAANSAPGAYQDRGWASSGSSDGGASSAAKEPPHRPHPHTYTKTGSTDPGFRPLIPVSRNWIFCSGFNLARSFRPASESDGLPIFVP
jgi:hypothetical protein